MHPHRFEGALVRARLLVPLALLLGAACSVWPFSGGAPSRADVDRLAAQARAAARTDGCNGSGDCRAAPMGAKACGGPSSYVVYCAKTTDTVSLFAKIAEATRAEREYNEASGVASDCMFLAPPRLECADGTCRVVQP